MAQRGSVKLRMVEWMPALVFAATKRGASTVRRTRKPGMLTSMFSRLGPLASPLVTAEILRLCWRLVRGLRRCERSYSRREIVARTQTERRGTIVAVYLYRTDWCDLDQW